MQAMVSRKTSIWSINRRDILFLAGMGMLVEGTILAGDIMEDGGATVRRWYWDNFCIVLALVACAGLQKKIGLPPVSGNPSPPFPHWKGLLAGIIFGLMDVLVIKFILHPQAYENLPPFLQPFPYSALLYPSGAIEIETVYRLIPLTSLLLIDRMIFRSTFRVQLIILIGILSSLVEPLLQFPGDGALWFMIYATITGVGMNALEFYVLIKNGFASALLVRLGHYLIWHIALGIFVQYVELA